MTVATLTVYALVRMNKDTRRTREHPVKAHLNPDGMQWRRRTKERPLVKRFSGRLNQSSWDFACAFADHRHMSVSGVIAYALDVLKSVQPIKKKARRVRDIRPD